MYKEQIIFNTLQRYFGFDSFRNGQKEIINNVLEGNDTLAVMPTGGGKSLCYQLPAILAQGTALVISPLISLMKDQVDVLLNRGISSAFINSTISYAELSERMERAKAGAYKLLYIAPERLENRRFLESLKSIDISFLAVDEAHCISEWGHDFRPAYLNISQIINLFNNIPLMALTATATPEVQDDIVNALKMKNPQRFIKGFDRPNLSYITEKVSDKISRIVDILSHTKEGSTIIYCGSRKRVDSIATGLNTMGFEVLSYHAGQHDNYRQYTQEKFISGNVDIIVATSAFGMGIDKADVRNVIHCDLTPSLEAYYQEAGRAGRDGFESKCYLLYHPNDRKLQDFFINATFPTQKDIENIYNFLYDLNEVGLGNKSYDTIFMDETEIANKLNKSAIAVHSVINLLERNKILRRGSTDGIAKMKFTTSQERIIEYYQNIDDKKKHVLESLLRSLSSEVFENDTELDIKHFTKKYDINLDELKNAIRHFEFARILTFTFPGFSKGISLLKERTEFKFLPIDFIAYENRRKNSVKKLNMVQQYAETLDCKRNFILQYFQETDVEDECRKCSSCKTSPALRNQNTEKLKFLESSIINSCIELNGAFGKTNLIAYIKGQKNESIEKHNLSRGSLYASCKDYTVEDIKHGIDKAIFDEKIFASNDRYATLKAGEKYIKNNTSKPLNLEIFQGTYDKEYFQKLQAIRNNLALKNRMNERSIISDKLLRKIAELKPKSVSELKTISGITDLFIENFANSFLEIEKNSNQVNQVHNFNPSPELVKISELINKRHNIDEICRYLKMSKADLALVLQDAIENGYKLNLSYVFQETDIAQIVDILKKKPAITLSQLRAGYDFTYDYPELRIALAISRNLIQIKFNLKNKD
jgi:ATP-dependent DNA helicase RecQ